VFITSHHTATTQTYNHRQETTVLPAIPAKFRLTGETHFVRDPENPALWLVLGRAVNLPVGELAQVLRRSGPAAVIEVKEYMAEHITRHRPGSYSHQVHGDWSRWVLATFTGIQS
jgi:hypothetical protein